MRYEPRRYEPDIIPDLLQRWAVYDNDACDICHRAESEDEAHGMANLLNIRAMLAGSDRRVAA